VSSTPHVVIIGGGGAALRACLAAAERGARVTLVSKGRAGASGCTHAIDSKIEFSVVNSPMPVPDTPSTYVADLEAVGQRLKSSDRLRLFAERSVDELGFLERLGVPLADARGYRRIQLAGSSVSRGIICPPRFGTRVLQALWTALAASPRPMIFHSDNGSEYNARAFVAVLTGFGIPISRTHPGCPWENGYQESFYDKFKVDLGDPNRFQSLGELVAEVYGTLWAYNHTRIHSALKMPPAVFAESIGLAA